MIVSEGGLVELDLDEIAEAVARFLEDTHGYEVLDVSITVEADGQVSASVEVAEAEEN